MHAKNAPVFSERAGDAARSILHAIARAIARFHRDERGQAMTEAAIVLPIFVTTIAMTLELCVLATVKSVVNFGAYSACRAGIVHNGDPEWMVFAASLALSPVTQSNILPAKVGTQSYRTYGTWEWEGPKDRREAGDGKAAVSYSGGSFIDSGAGGRGLGRTLNLVAGTGIALLQFNKAYSTAEYFMLDAVDISGLLASVTSISSLDDILNIIDTVQGLVDSFDKPINRLQVLVADPPDSTTVAAETGTFTGLFEFAESDVAALGTTTDDLMTETGATKTGINFIDIRSGRNKSLRFRVRLIHRHMLIFPFLRGIYGNVLERRDEQGTSLSDEEQSVVTLGTSLGMVEITGDAVMQMQSNLTLADD